jgi:hypothetical protein
MISVTSSIASECCLNSSIRCILAVLIGRHAAAAAVNFEQGYSSGGLAGAQHQQQQRIDSSGYCNTLAVHLSAVHELAAVAPIQ